MIGIKSVSTRTQDECILKFLQLLIEDPYFEEKERVFFSEIDLLISKKIFLLNKTVFFFVVVGEQLISNRLIVSSFCDFSEFSRFILSCQKSKSVVCSQSELILHDFLSDRNSSSIIKINMNSFSVKETRMRHVF